MSAPIGAFHYSKKLHNLHVHNCKYEGFGGLINMVFFVEPAICRLIHNFQSRPLTSDHTPYVQYMYL